MNHRQDRMPREAGIEPSGGPLVAGAKSGNKNDNSSDDDGDPNEREENGRGPD